MTLLGRLSTAPGLVKWLPVVILALPLGYLLVKLFRDLRQRRQARPPRRRVELRHAWRAFLRRTPLAQRRTFGLLQPIVVLGENSAGKSALIDRFVNWRGHAEQLQPSHVEDAQLQIYRGAQVLVQELSGALLEDTSPEGRRALERLWRALPSRRRRPRVILVVDSARLMRGTPDQLVRRAQLMRGKIDLLAERFRQPIDVTVMVTKSDRLTGFVDVAALLRERKLTLRVRPGDAGAGISDGLARFEQLLPQLQASAGAPVYLRALGFFEQLPSLLAPLDRFVSTLCSPQSTTAVPHVVAVALDSNEDDGPRLWSPFAATISSADVRRFHPLRKHALIAAALAGTCALWLVAAFTGQRARIDDGLARLDAWLDAPSDSDAQADWRQGVEQARRTLASRLTPSFFPGDADFGALQLRRSFVMGARHRLLEPRLSSHYNDASTLYALSLLQSSNRGPLGKLVAAHAAQWGDALMLPPSLVRSYVAAVDASLPPPDAPETVEPAALRLDADSPELARWLTDVHERLQQPVMSPAELRALADEAARAQRDAARLVASETLAEATRLLRKESAAALEAPAPAVGELPGPAAARGLSLPAAVAALAALVTESKLEPEDLTGVDLVELSARLSRIADAPYDHSAPAIALTVGRQHFDVDPAAWHALVLRSRLTLLVHDLVARQDEGDALLFAHPEQFPALELTTRGDGCGFGGGVSIPGHYTARAFEEHLAPTLATLPKLIEKLPIGAGDKEQLVTHIDEALGSWADDYATQYRNLMAALACHARTPIELRLLVTQSQSSSAPLRLALREVSRNTALTLPKDSPFGASIESLADEFAPLRALSPAVGPPTQLAGWLAVLHAMQAALDGRAPPPPAPATATADKEPEDGLRSRLTPVGRLALAVYRGDEDSPKLQTERWLLQAGLDSDWWPAFSAPVEEAYRLGRRELQTVVADTWSELSRRQLQPLADSFPFRRDAESPASNDVVEAALGPKQAFWSSFDATLGPLLMGVRDGFSSREGRNSPLLPPALLPKVNRLTALAGQLWDKDGKPRPLIVHVRPLPLPPQRADAPAVLTSFLQLGGSTVYGFNQRAEWTALKVEWWHADSASVGVSVGAKDGRSFRAVSILDAPWSLWRLLVRGASSDGHIFTWQVSGPDGRALPVQFEIKEEPWARFAL